MRSREQVKRYRDTPSAIRFRHAEILRSNDENKLVHFRYMWAWPRRTAVNEQRRARVGEQVYWRRKRRPEKWFLSHI